MVLEKQDPAVIDQFSEQYHVVRHTGAMATLSSDQWETRFYLKEKKGSKFLSGETICVCVCVCVCTPLNVTVLFLLLLSITKQRLLSILTVTLALTLSPALAPGASPSHCSMTVLSLADIQDKEDTPLRKMRCLLKIRQNLRGAISFISRPTSINPHLKTIRAAVEGGSSDESNLPSYAEERERCSTSFRFWLFLFL